MVGKADKPFICFIIEIEPAVVRPDPKIAVAVLNDSMYDIAADRAGFLFSMYMMGKSFSCTIV